MGALAGGEVGLPRQVARPTAVIVLVIATERDLAA